MRPEVETFVAAIVAGASKSEAYRRAFPGRTVGNPAARANKLLSRKAVRERLALLGFAGEGRTARGADPEPQPIEDFIAALEAGRSKAAAFMAVFPDRRSHASRNADRFMAKPAVRARLVALGLVPAAPDAGPEAPTAVPSDPATDPRLERFARLVAAGATATDPGEHALALLRWLQGEGGRTGEVLSRDVQACYRDMCCELGPHSPSSS
jgi:hypothetical protein